jgi:hypothetical protein
MKFVVAIRKTVSELHHVHIECSSAAELARGLPDLKAGVERMVFGIGVPLLTVVDVAGIVENREELPQNGAGNDEAQPGAGNRRRR